MQIQAITLPHYKANGMLQHHKKSNAVANTEMAGSSYGFLDGTDGQTWHYVQENTTEDYNYTASTVTVYDSKREVQGSFTVTIPDGMRVNMIEPFGLVTSKLFDNNSSTKEVIVYLHEVGNEDNNYQGQDHLYVYNLNGEKVTEFIGDGMIVDASPNEWTSWQRLIVSHENEDGKNVDIDIYRSPSWGEESAVLDKTFQLDKFTITYTDGPFVHFFNVDKNPYFVLCHYEKPFVEYDENGNQVMDEETWMPIFTENNNFVIETYDKYYNHVNSISVPRNVPSDDYLVRMNSFGIFSEKDLTNGYFTGDSKLNYIIMNEDVTPTTEYVTSFDVYDENGTFVNNIAKEVGDNYKKLTNIGNEEQWIFIDSEGGCLFAVDLPSCKQKDIPTTVGGYSISFNLDRVPANNEVGYNYVMGINEAKTDETETNVIAMFSYLNPDFSVIKTVDVNLGPLAQTFTPLISEEGLNPYLINTDEQRELLFFSKVRDNEESTEGHNVLYIANDNGEIVESFNLEPGNEKGDIYSAMILNYGKAQPSLFINYYDWDNDRNTLEFYDLPLKTFGKGGDGTEQNPYLISSVGDLTQISKHPEAHYRVANDIDAHGYSAAINEFSGTLDGAGHAIENLNLTSNNYYGGLFGSINAATIKDLTFKSPIAELSSDNQQFGIITAFAVESNISNIQIYDAKIIGNDTQASPMGIIAGMASANTTISDCYISGAEVENMGMTIGGIAGEMRTSSVVERCAIDNSQISARFELGGITGIIGTGCVVKDCAVSGTLTANRYMGGIAGRCGVSSNRGNIERCIFNGELNCPMLSNDADDVAEYAIGGIAGYIEPDWSKTGTGMISSCVVYDSYLTTNNNHFYWPEHLRIAGQTINWEDSSVSEAGLANNYQVQVDLDGAETPGFNDPTSVFGALVNHDVADTQDFWTNIGYLFGEDNTAPWIMVENKRPHLYFETGFNPTEIKSIISGNTSHVREGIFTLNGVRLNNISTPGLYIINGKKTLVK